MKIKLDQTVKAKRVQGESFMFGKHLWKTHLTMLHLKPYMSELCTLFNPVVCHATAGFSGTTKFPYQ